MSRVEESNAGRAVTAAVAAARGSSSLRVSIGSAERVSIFVCLVISGILSGERWPHGMR